MFESGHHEEQDGAEDLLRRALLDDSSAVSVSLRIDGLPVSEAVTVVFYARRDLGTLQTYLTPGSRGAGSVLSAGELLRVPCDLDLADAEDADEARELYGAQARTLRDAVLSADVVLAVWREPLQRLAGRVIEIDHRVNLDLALPKPRLLPTALIAPDLQLLVTAVTSPRTLAEGRPPLGIVCAQQDVTKIYPLQEDPEACVVDFLDYSANRARRLAERLAHQEASVERFLEISDAA
ncbi:hypothetical protein [Conexibacter sp. DBS9H8]|uniref:hypothetical protein n=1 Tax=Conexibacter sp. DBS9H8 TaxID=2937801 RepID=UPI002010A028|nr:hypothetical protein [Conexibacter sp. DBS9H8]